jgi:hypothetical protein
MNILGIAQKAAKKLPDNIFLLIPPHNFRLILIILGDDRENTPPLFRRKKSPDH